MSIPQYIVLRNSANHGWVVDFTANNPHNYDSVKSYDQLLHRTLRKIFRERRLNSHQIKELLCLPVGHKSKGSIFRQILKRESAFASLFRNRYELSLLWMVVLCGYQDSAELLVRSGANVNELYGSPMTCDRRLINEQSTILHAVLAMYPSAWNEQFIALLIEHGADLRVRDLLENTVLHSAVRNGRVRMANLFLEMGFDVNVAGGKDITPVLEAARNRKANELVPLLMAHGADVNVKDTKNMNALHYLAYSSGDHADVARALLREGVSLDERDSQKDYQPIHVAALQGKNKLVNLYLKRGADVNSLAIDNRSPLCLAAISTNPAVLVTLVKHGADVDLKDDLERTALHVACEQSLVPSSHSLEKINILLLAGATMFVEDYENYTPFDRIHSEDIQHPNSRLMLKTLALRKALLQPTIEFKDERIIRNKYPMLRNYYLYCVEMIEEAKSKRFSDCCTFFELLTKCQCQIAPFMRNPEFKEKFEQHDPSDFLMYKEDILEAFERAERFNDAVLKQEKVTSKGFRNMMPELVVRKIARFVVNCDMCEIRRSVREAPESTNGTDNTK